MAGEVSSDVVDKAAVGAFAAAAGRGGFRRGRRARHWLRSDGPLVKYLAVPAPIRSGGFEIVWAVDEPVVSRAFYDDRWLDEQVQSTLLWGAASRIRPASSWTSMNLDRVETKHQLDTLVADIEVQVSSVLQLLATFTDRQSLADVLLSSARGNRAPESATRSHWYDFPGSEEEALAEGAMLLAADGRQDAPGVLSHAMSGLPYSISSLRDDTAWRSPTIRCPNRVYQNPDDTYIPARRAVARLLGDVLDPGEGSDAGPNARSVPPPPQVGSVQRRKLHRGHWFPAEDLEALDDTIVGTIEVVERFEA